MVYASLAILRDDLKRRIAQAEMTWVMGRPGSGKNFLMDALMGGSSKWFSLDDAGQDIEGVFKVVLTKNQKLLKASIFVGTSENEYEIFEQISEIARLRHMSRIFHILIPIPTLGVFSEANRLKSISSKDVPNRWKQYWASQAKFSEHQLWRAIRKDISLHQKHFAKWLTRTRYFTEFEISLVLVPEVSKIRTGWHGEVQSS
jgi:hypothetical protein